MSISSAIGAVSESLQDLLEGEMVVPYNRVTLRTPDKVETSGNTVNLFLYKVIENPFLRNQDWQVDSQNPRILIPPPLSLNLFYVVTAYNLSDQEEGDIVAHELMGDCMRVFYENSIVPREYLNIDLKNAREEIRVMLNTVDMDELSRMWSTFGESFRLSVMYEVSVVQLDMLPDKDKEMAKRVWRTGVPQISAPYIPPVLERMEPTEGVPGTVVTFYGQNLEGWTPYIVIGGTQVLDIENPSAESFQVTLPSLENLDPGYNEIWVDIGSKARQTYLFNVIKPSIETYEPAEGPDGTTVTFNGYNLAGFYAHVDVYTLEGGVNRETILDGILLNEENDTSFDAVLDVPANFPPGSAEISVIIGTGDDMAAEGFQKAFEGTFSFKFTA